MPPFDEYYVLNLPADQNIPHRTSSLGHPWAAVCLMPAPILRAHQRPGDRGEARRNRTGSPGRVVIDKGGVGFYFVNKVDLVLSTEEKLASVSTRYPLSKNRSRTHLLSANQTISNDLETTRDTSP